MAVTISYDDLSSVTAGILDIQYVAKSVIKKEEERGESVVVQPLALAATDLKKPATGNTEDKKNTTVSSSVNGTSSEDKKDADEASSVENKETDTAQSQNIRFAKKSLTIGVGETTSIKISSSEKITYSSSKKSVVSINKNGKIVGKKAGKAVITAKTKSGASAKCKVTVK